MKPTTDGESICASESVVPAHSLSMDTDTQASAPLDANGVVCGVRQVCSIVVHVAAILEPPEISTYDAIPLDNEPLNYSFD